MCTRYALENTCLVARMRMYTYCNNENVAPDKLLEVDVVFPADEVGIP